MVSSGMVINPAKIPVFFKTLGQMSLSVAPYWVIGIAIGSALLQVVSIEKIKKSRMLYGFPGIIAGAVLGVVSPIGLYGALPVSFSLGAAGVPVATIFSFLIATPLINPNLFVYTAGVFGYSMAFARLFSALALGIAGGAVIWMLGRINRSSLLVGTSILFTEADRSGPAAKSRLVGRGSFKGFCREFIHFIRFSAPWFLVAMTIAALIEVFVPRTLVQHLVGSKNIFSVPIAAALSIPLYICGGNTIPFVHELVNSGMDRGAALAFFIAGPATKISNITFLSSILGVRGVAFFLTITLGAAVLFGYWYGFARL